MSGWIADMANAVDAHEAAQAPPTSKAAGPPSMPAVSIEETPTEPATSPRMRPVPLYLEELRLPTREIGHKRSLRSLSLSGWSMMEAIQMRSLMHYCVRHARHSTTMIWNWRRNPLFEGRERHMIEVSRNGRGESQLETSQITVIFHVVHLQQELHLCAYFLMSMQHFVKVIPLWLHIHNQSLRRLHRLWEGRCHQSSIQTRNLQGLVLQCSLHHQRHHVQMQLKA